MSDFACRSCGQKLGDAFLDLGLVPLSNDYRRVEELDGPQSFYPLRVWACDRCFLVQVHPAIDPQILFRDYAYFSSYSRTWLEHAAAYAEGMIRERRLDAESLVVEVASNDGYLLKNFVKRGIPVLGIEPARNVAAVAEEQGVPSVAEFFGAQLARELAEQGRFADLLVANNVLAHVPDLNDFVAGIRILLKPEGLATLEFPHLLRLMQGRQFDTIYHEHFSYLSLLAAEEIFQRHGLRICDVEELPTHGGSLRLHVAHRESGRERGPAVERLLAAERAAGLDRMAAYAAFSKEIEELKRNITAFLIRLKREGMSLAAYGAAAKATILLHYCGLTEGFLDYAVDLSPHKQGRCLPGTAVPIFSPDKVWQSKPDCLIITAWNLRKEIVAQMGKIREWGGKFAVLLPEPELDISD